MKSGKLRGKMAEAGYSQKRLADEIDMSEGTLGNKLSGKTKFNTDEILKICDVLGIEDNSEKADIFLS